MVSLNSLSQTVFRVSHYNLDATFQSGQTFRWIMHNQGWEGVIGNRWIRLESLPGGIKAYAFPSVQQWAWLETYLQLHRKIHKIIHTFPQDPPLMEAVRFNPGLRILRQDPWECLASFILSSTKRIVQIQQIVKMICQRYGTPICTPEGIQLGTTFPCINTVASLSETDLRECKMGFRAPLLLAAAKRLSEGKIKLEDLPRQNIVSARQVLVDLPGVGPKIADCVLLFSLGFDAAFPIDVWMQKVVTKYYFDGNEVSLTRIREFVARHFGPYAGYAQQYLFHYYRNNS